MLVSSTRSLRCGNMSLDGDQIEILAVCWRFDSSDPLCSNVGQIQPATHPINYSVPADIVATAVPSDGCTWNKSLEPPIVPTQSRWGWRCTVTPIYSIDNLGGEVPGLKEELEALRCLYGSGDVRHDHALVR